MITATTMDTVDPRAQVSMEFRRPGRCSGEGMNGLDVALGANLQSLARLLKRAASVTDSGGRRWTPAVSGSIGKVSTGNETGIVEAAQDILDVVMVTSEPSALAYGLDLLTDAVNMIIGGIRP